MKDYTIALLLFILGIAVIANLPACYSKSKSMPNPEYVICRAEILENFLVTWIKLDSVEQLVYRPRDTVWVDMESHRICDTCQYGMKAQLFSTIKQ